MMDWSKLPVSSPLGEDPSFINTRIPYSEAVQKQLIQPDISTHHTLAQLPDFQYKSLPDSRSYIRLLYLHKPRQIREAYKEVLSCASIVHVSLQEAPPFLALSYVWGPSNVKVPIILNGTVCWVTENLASALEHLADHDEVLPLWVDAISINQKNDKEKSAQVQQMGNIYRAANLVLGWLGPSAEDSDLAMKALSYIGERNLEMPDGPALEERHRFFEEVLPTNDEDPEIAFPTAGVVSLLSRAWWRRVWVVQEVVLAKDVYVLCGRMNASFAALLLGFAALFELPLLNASLQGALSSRIQNILPVLRCDPRLVQAALLGHNQDPQPLGRRLLDVRGMGASDPRDYVFALLGMASDVDQLDIYADYSKPCAEIYTETAAAFIIRQGNLQILSRCRFPKQQWGLPSWVPDWSLPLGVTIWDPRHHLFSTGRCPRVPKYETASGSLKLRGAIFGTVKVVGWSWSSLSLDDVKDIPKLLRCGLKKVQDLVNLHCDAYRTAQTKEDAIWRAPILDTEFGLFSSTGRYNRRALPAMRSAFDSIKGDDPSTSTNEQPDVTRYTSTMIDVFKGRAFFTTDTGHLGIGPQHLQPGDLVCIVLGADVPFILRKLNGHSSERGMWFWRKAKISYQLVGECYVHGIMDGEFLADTPRIEDFCLL